MCRKSKGTTRKVVKLIESIEQIASQLLEQAFQLQASDIHFSPRKHDTHIYFRLHDQLLLKHRWPHSDSERLISRFKFFASMDIGEKRRPQSGAHFLYVHDTPVHLRFSTLPSSFGESLVIRLMPQTTQVSLHELSLFPSITRKLCSLVQHAHGLLIFTGPTGSGKTTSVYSLIQYASQIERRHVITLEDPVEQKSEDMLQVQVNEKAGITYATGLKAILRHDPDVILVGEIRDEETARVAIRAAMTGHLVLTTMHTKDAAGAISRLQELGIPKQDIQETLIGVSAQRLVRRVCPICGENCRPYCPYHEKRRACICELLAGRDLQHFYEGKQTVRPPYTLDRWLRKAICYGFVPEEEYKRWKLREEAPTP
ncbi:competence type IV pilus ATPase ComGA [Bacillus fonticola]|uniref:competence type IV pilus ATPase ComGA n=1 Tax=Bacillus fonticola TaxID=2728853 RepID=UPI002AD4D591|nr:competence type IV pilus ATPase ComGA [Bacillus fonticola]